MLRCTLSDTLSPIDFLFSASEVVINNATDNNIAFLVRDAENKDNEQNK